MTGTATATKERRCPECEEPMTLVHQGRFSTMYLCPACGSTLTLPPPEPLALTKAAPA
jgi:transposase-like protein